jgi:hypothetical protein
LSKGRTKKRGKSRPKRTLKARLISFGLVMVCLYFAYMILSLQIEIYKARQIDEELHRQINEQQLENDEIMRLLGHDEEEYMERVAREKGYADPDDEDVYETL